MSNKASFCFEKLSESLIGSNRKHRSKIYQDTVEKHVNKNLPEGYTAGDVDVADTFFQYFSPQLSFKLFGPEGENIVRPDDNWSPEGEVMSTLRKKWFRDNYSIDADALYLKPEHQKKGLGSSLFKSMVDAAEELEANKIHIMADEDGKHVWPKMDGVEFRKKTKRQAYKDYKKWRQEHGGPEVSRNDPPHLNIPVSS